MGLALERTRSANTYKKGIGDPARPPWEGEAAPGRRVLPGAQQPAETLGLLPRELGGERAAQAVFGDGVHGPPCLPIVDVQSNTFKAVATRLVAAAELADTTRSKWTWRLDARVFPRIGDRPIAGIKRADVRELLYDRKDKPIKGANDTLKVIRWVFDRALDDPKLGLEYNPARELRKPTKERPRSRVLTTNELRAVWLAAEREAAQLRATPADDRHPEDRFDLYCDAVRLDILTGAREAEVFEVPKTEFDLEEQVWHIPESPAAEEPRRARRAAAEDDDPDLARVPRCPGRLVVRGEAA
jgi:hypothetical protein